MPTDNPYTVPQSSQQQASPAIALWISACIFGSMIAGSLLGVAIGICIGRFAPGYYRTVFSAHSDPAFDAISMGIGLGLTQGAVGGAVIGVTSVALFLWYRSR